MMRFVFECELYELPCCLLLFIYFFWFNVCLACIVGFVVLGRFGLKVVVMISYYLLGVLFWVFSWLFDLGV